MLSNEEYKEVYDMCNEIETRIMSLNIYNSNFIKWQTLLELTPKKPNLTIREAREIIEQVYNVMEYTK